MTQSNESLQIQFPPQDLEPRTPEPNSGSGLASVSNSQVQIQPPPFVDLLVDAFADWTEQERINLAYFQENDYARFLTPNLLNIVRLLNDQQFQAVTGILEWSKTILTGQDTARTLVGFAGSGKTFCLRLLAYLLPFTVLCAPTNKACKELQKLQTGRPCFTIYSLLGLRMEQVEDTIKLTKTEVNKASKYKYVILDEAGMVNRQLFEYIKDAMSYGTRFIFVGDPKQLPPVGEAHSLVFDRYPTHKLLKVMRHDNQILSMATHVRKSRLSEIEFANDNDNNEGVWYLDQDDFNSEIKRYAKRDQFAQDTKVLAWRNRTVDAYNKMIRTSIYGKEEINRSQFLVNDRVVMTAPYEIDGQIALTTDDELVVKSVYVEVERINHLTCYFLEVQHIDSGLKYTITCIHESSEADLQEMLADLAREARRPKCGHLWRHFWGLKQRFAQVKYAYALTVHRSQGSTFENVFVDCDDILVNSNRKEAKRCLYVAVSRPSRRLFLC